MRRVRPFVCLSAAGVAKPALSPDCAGTVVCCLVPVGCHLAGCPQIPSQSKVMSIN